MILTYDVTAEDISSAGKASTEIKKALGKLGVDPKIVKRTAVAMYEAEINMVIHGGGGIATATIKPEGIEIVMEDHGPGIPDIELAMNEGYSTAPEWIREMGFGAGMGLPNMKRNADDLQIITSPGNGTKVIIKVNFTNTGN